MIPDPPENEVGAKVYPAAEQLSEFHAVATLGEARIGTLRKNTFGYWEADTAVGTRFYSNPLPAAMDLYFARHITAREAAHVHLDERTPRPWRPKPEAKPVGVHKK